MITSIKNVALTLFSAALLVACSNEATTEQANNEAATAPEKQEAPTPAPAEEPKAEIAGYQVGDMAEDFNLKNVDGNMVSMASYPDAKGFVIVFTCNHCPYSIAYEDRLIALNDKYAPQGYPVIAINPNDPELVPDDSFEKMVERSENKGFTFPYLMDEGQKVYPKYGATKTPHVYVVNKTEEGNKVAYIGAIDDSKEEADVSEKYLEPALEALLKGEEPSPNFTKAFGCSVKCTKEKKEKQL